MLAVSGCAFLRRIRYPCSSQTVAWLRPLAPPAGNSRPDSSPPAGKFPSGGEQQFPMDKIGLALGEYAVQLCKSAGLPHAKNATHHVDFLKQSPAPTGQSRPDGENSG